MPHLKSVIEEILMKGLLTKKWAELRKIEKTVKDPGTRESWKPFLHLGVKGQDVWIWLETMDRESHQTGATA